VVFCGKYPHSDSFACTLKKSVKNQQNPVSIAILLIFQGK